MVDPTPSDYHLTYLRERWERDRSSRIFLQLAEEYRRRGMHPEALEVLETGLSFHPGYLAAQVALGRCRLEAGQADEAVKVLERVLTQDPTQAVATRLLAESWLQLGDEDRTQATIDRCRLIGIPPSELMGLEHRLAAARRAGRERRHEPAVAPPAAPLAAPPIALEPAEPADDLAWQETTRIDLAPAAAVVAAREQAPRPPADAKEAPLMAEVVVQAAGEIPPSPLAVPPPPTSTSTPTLPPSLPPTLPPTPAPISPTAVDAVFSLPPPSSRAVVLPLRPGGDRRLTVAHVGDPFGSLARSRQRTGTPSEIFRLLPRPIPGAAAVTQADAAAAPSEAAPPLAPPVALGAAGVPVAGTLGASGLGPAADAAPEVAASPESAAAGSLGLTPAAVEPPLPEQPPTATSERAAQRPARATAPSPARWWDRPPETPAAGAAMPAEPPAPPQKATAPGRATPPPFEAPAPGATPATSVASEPLGAPAPPSFPIPAAAAPLAPTAPTAPPPSAPAPSPRRSPLADAPGIELQPSGIVANPELRPSDPGTATLGELYLRQGYIHEAEQIFKQVLARDAENEAALTGLETIGRRRAQKLTAAELLAGGEVSEEKALLGLTARKVQLLTRYLRTLRRGAGNDVPRTPP